MKNNGTLISEHSIKDEICDDDFINRNRIVSGISKAVVVVEAGKNSGSLTTANYALAQGREVYAVPGDINNKMSEGTNKLIQDGAKIFIL